MLKLLPNGNLAGAAYWIGSAERVVAAMPKTVLLACQMERMLREEPIR